MIVYMHQAVANYIIGDSKTIDRNIYLDTSLCIQVVAPKLQERRLYQAMQVVDSIVNGSDRSKARTSSL